jgi:hypothetical protein
MTQNYNPNQITENSPNLQAKLDQLNTLKTTIQKAQELNNIRYNTRGLPQEDLTDLKQQYADLKVELMRSGVSTNNPQPVSKVQPEKSTAPTKKEATKPRYMDRIKAALAMVMITVGANVLPISPASAENVTPTNIIQEVEYKGLNNGGIMAGLQKGGYLDNMFRARANKNGVNSKLVEKEVQELTTKAKNLIKRDALSPVEAFVATSLETPTAKAQDIKDQKDNGHRDRISYQEAIKTIKARTTKVATKEAEVVKAVKTPTTSQPESKPAEPKPAVATTEPQKTTPTVVESPKPSPTAKPQAPTVTAPKTAFVNPALVPATPIAPAPKSPEVAVSPSPSPATVTKAPNPVSATKPKESPKHQEQPTKPNTITVEPKISESGELTKEEQAHLLKDVPTKYKYYVERDLSMEYTKLRSPQKVKEYIASIDKAVAELIFEGELTPTQVDFLFKGLPDSKYNFETKNFGPDSDTVKTLYVDVRHKFFIINMLIFNRKVDFSDSVVSDNLIDLQSGLKYNLRVK